MNFGNSFGLALAVFFALDSLNTEEKKWKVIFACFSAINIFMFLLLN